MYKSKIKNHPKTTILLMSFVVKCLYLFNRRSTAMNQLQLMFFFATIQLELPRLLWEIQDTLALPGTLQHTHASHRFRNPTIPSHPILQETTIPSLFSGLPNEGWNWLRRGWYSPCHQEVNSTSLSSSAPPHLRPECGFRPSWSWRKFFSPKINVLPPKKTSEDIMSS